MQTALNAFYQQDQHCVHQLQDLIIYGKPHALLAIGLYAGGKLTQHKNIGLVLARQNHYCFCLSSVQCLALDDLNMVSNVLFCI